MSGKAWPRKAVAMAPESLVDYGTLASRSSRSQKARAAN